MNKMRYLRIGIAAAVLLVIFACTFAHVPIGTLCALCPVGFAEISVASGTVLWELLPGVLVLLGVVLLLGRVFCSWVCPTSLLRNIFGGRMPHGLTGRTGQCIGCAAASSCNAKAADCTASDADVEESKTASEKTLSEEMASNEATSDIADPNNFRLRNNLAAQGMVLVVLLVVSFIVHFPVFCLFCPIGLVFGTMFAVSRMFVTWQPGWELIVFPAMLALELFVLRRWCSAICPLGFFFGLMAKARSKVKALPHVHVNHETCIHSQGCEVCTTTCPENICAATSDPRDLEDCTMCLDCREHCPSRAIGMIRVPERKAPERK